MRKKISMKLSTRKNNATTQQLDHLLPAGSLLMCGLLMLREDLERYYFVSFQTIFHKSHSTGLKL
jgi:hypothetical protein